MGFVFPFLLKWWRLAKSIQRRPEIMVFAVIASNQWRCYRDSWNLSTSFLSPFPSLSSKIQTFPNHELLFLRRWDKRAHFQFRCPLWRHLRIFLFEKEEGKIVRGGIRFCSFSSSAAFSDRRQSDVGEARRGNTRCIGSCGHAVYSSRMVFQDEGIGGNWWVRVTPTAITPVTWPGWVLSLAPNFALFYPARMEDGFVTRLTTSRMAREIEERWDSSFLLFEAWLVFPAIEAINNKRTIRKFEWNDLAR